eukprot:13355871-Ditylum_brightwellii.AAC.1
MNHFNYTVDYKNTVFEKPELTHVHGEPTMANFLTLRNKLQANSQAVSTTLGGERHGHLGLVMTPQDYALIPKKTQAPTRPDEESGQGDQPESCHGPSNPVSVQGKNTDKTP